jgi:plasmid stabilization system protein ParE
MGGSATLVAAEAQVAADAPGTGDDRNRLRQWEFILLIRMTEELMPRGDKSKYTDKQKRKAEHIADSYKSRGTSTKEAKRRAYATVNKESGGGNKSGSGRGKKDTNVSSKRGGKRGGAASASRPAAARSASAKKAAATRKRNSAKKAS